MLAACCGGGAHRSTPVVMAPAPLLRVQWFALVCHPPCPADRSVAECDPLALQLASGLICRSIEEK